MTGKTGRGMRPWPRAPRTLYKAWARRGGTLYKAVVQYTILEGPSARPWFGRTDAEQEERGRNWESDKKTPVKGTLPSAILYFWCFINSISFKLSMVPSPLD